MSITNPIIIPVMLGREMTRRAIASALAQDIGNVHVIVVDNGSTDGCGPMLRSMAEILYWPRTERSLHRVWNEALSWCFDTHGLEHALVINNDVVLRSDMYRVLLANGGQFVTGVGVDKMTSEPLPHDLHEHRSPHPSFSCFLMRREVWRHVGGFDEDYWAWCGDADYHLRMDRVGIDAYALAVPFLHQVSGTLKQSDPETRERLCKLADADRARFKLRWGCEVGSDEYYSRFRSKRENKYQVTGRLA